MSKILFAFLFMFSGAVHASNSENEQEDPYQKGIALRNANKFEEARALFLPLAQDGNPRAAHNYARCCYEMGQDFKAYRWFKVAADAGLEPSANNLTKINLIFLLPDELLARIMSNLKMKDFFSLKETCHRFNTISKIPYLKKGYDAHELLKNVQFTPEPMSISVERCLEVGNNTLEIHFRDVEHLERVARRVPHARAKDIIFVRDREVEEFKELSVSGSHDQAAESLFIWVQNDGPVDPIGSCVSPCGFLFPGGTPLNAHKFTFSTSGGGGASTGDPVLLSESSSLIAVLKELTPESLAAQTHSASTLLSDRKESRESHPTLYRALTQLDVSLSWFCRGSVSFEPTDDLKSESPIIHVSKSANTLNSILEQYPTMSSILLVDEMLNIPGVCSLSPFSLQEGFLISCDDNLAFMGKLNIGDHNLRISATGHNLYFIGVQLHADSITLSADSFYNLNASPGMEKPEGMSISMWIDIRRRRGWIE